MSVEEEVPLRDRLVGIGVTGIISILQNRFSGVLPFPAVIAMTATLAIICIVWVWKTFASIRRYALTTSIFASVFSVACFTSVQSLESRLPQNTVRAQEVPRAPSALPAAQQGTIPPLLQNDPHLQLNNSELHKKMRVEYWDEQYDHYYPGNRRRPATQQRVDWINRQLAKEGTQAHAHITTKASPQPTQPNCPSGPTVVIRDNYTDHAQNAVVLSGELGNCVEVSGNTSTNIRGAAIEVNGNRQSQ